MFHKDVSILFIVTSLFAFATYTAEAQKPPLAIAGKGLVGYWTLDKIKEGKVEDIIGDNKGTLQGNPKIVKGKYDNALAFDGVDDFILLGTNNIPTGNSAMTISAWFFKDKRAIPGRQAFVSFGVWDCCGTCFAVLTLTGKRRFNNKLIMTHCVDNTPWDTSGPEATLGEWHHVAAVYDGAKKDILYLDGVEVVAKETPEAPDVNLGPIAGKLGEGAVIGGSTRPHSLWEGLIDEVGIYNRALTPDEVRRNATVKQIFAVEPGDKLSLTWAKIKASR